jgi:hypothetical protein
LPARVAQAQLFEKDRRELDPHDNDIQGDAGCDLEHDRVHVEVAWPEDMPEVPPAPQVESDRGTGQGIAEEAAEQGRTHQRMILALVEDVDQQRHAEAAAGQGRADEDVDHDPDAPGVAIVDVGRRTRPKNRRTTMIVAMTAIRTPQTSVVALNRLPPTGAGAACC